jgi:arsenate reductase
MTTPLERPSVLFVCVHNAGRSQMAAGFLSALSGGAVEVRSAGSAPAASVNPEDWALDDPAGQGIASVRPIRDAIRGRVLTLLDELGVTPAAG